MTINYSASKQITVAIYLAKLSFGGAELVALNQARGLKKLGVNVVLVVARDGGDLFLLAKSEFEIFHLGSKRVFDGLFQLASFLRKKKPDILMSHYLNCNITAILAKIAAQVITPLILIDHGLFLKSILKYNFIMRFLIKALARIFYKKANKVVAVSTSVAVETSRMSGIPQSAIQIIYNPVIPENFDDLVHALPDHPWLLERDSKTILAIGRLSPEKGFENLIKAFALVHKTSRSRLIILGEGTFRPELEYLIHSLNLKEYVSLPGFQSNVFSWLQKADLFVLSSLSESFGNVIVEALACGTPVVSTDLKGPAEILENGRFGALVPVNDPLLLAAAITKSLENDVCNRDTLRQRGHYFTIDRSAQDYNILINKLLFG